MTVSYRILKEISQGALPWGPKKQQADRLGESDYWKGNIKSKSKGQEVLCSRSQIISAQEVICMRQKSAADLQRNNKIVYRKEQQVKTKLVLVFGLCGPTEGHTEWPRLARSISDPWSEQINSKKCMHLWPSEGGGKILSMRRGEMCQEVRKL